MSEEVDINSMTPGSLIAPFYEVIGPIGKEHTWWIYLCRHTTSAKKVVIKCARTGSTASDVRRLQIEAKCMSRVSHRNVASVIDLGVTANGECFMVMEYLDAEPLSAIMQKSGTLSLDRFRNIFGQACDALNAVHKAGIVHRDIKPANFLISRESEDSEHLSLIDFNVAKVKESDPRSDSRQTGEIVGTPYYMSPEQCMGMDLDHRADIYSLGCCMYEAISGSPPFEGNTMVDTMSRHISDLPRLPIENKPEFAGLEYMLSRCLEKKPEDRFQSAAEVKQFLVGNPPKNKPSELLRGLDKGTKL